MEKVIISEDKIKEFIAKNDKRKVARLSNYKDLIERLLKEDISLNAIYEFILENDKEIGNKANFYKYIKNNFNTKLKPKTEKSKEDKKQTPIITATTPKPNMSQKATSVLSQDFDLLAFPS